MDLGSLTLMTVGQGDTVTGLQSHYIHLHNLFSDKGAKAAPTEAAAPAAAAPVKRLDNLFFIEEPKNVSVTESK